LKIRVRQKRKSITQREASKVEWMGLIMYSRLSFKSRDPLKSVQDPVTCRTPAPDTT